jgi:hypothetical protein
LFAWKLQIVIIQSFAAGVLNDLVAERDDFEEPPE